MRGFWCTVRAAMLTLGLMALPAFAANEAGAPVEGEKLVFDARQAAYPAPKPKTCLALDKVEIHGIALVDPKIIEEAVRPQLQRCLDHDVANKLVAAVNEVYSARGYITTQGYVPQQDIQATKTFRINIVVGRVAKVVYREKRQDQGFADAWDQLWKSSNVWQIVHNSSDLVDTLDNPADRMQLISPDSDKGPSLVPSLGRAKIAFALPLEEGDPVNLDHIQQGIDQINRASSQKASAKLEAGDQPGTSNVVISASRQDAFRLSAGYEINGASLNNPATTTQAKRIRFDLAKDNLIGLNDQIGASLASGLHSNEVRGSFSVPYRWLTFSLDGGYSENLSVLSPGVELFSKTFTGSANLSYLILRDKDQQTSVTGGVNWRHGARDVNDVALTPQTLSWLKTALSHTRYMETRQWTVSAGFSHGLTVLNATRDPAIPVAGAPRAQFFRLEGAGSGVQAFNGWGTLRVDANAQWTAHPLYADDQLVLGSLSTVRGFTRAPFKADLGTIVRSEFALAPSTAYLGEDLRKSLAPVEAYLSGFQPYVFADFGMGRDLAGHRRAERAAIGSGIRARAGRLSLDLSLAKPIYQEGLASTHETFKPEFYLTLTSKIF